MSIAEETKNKSLKVLQKNAWDWGNPPPHTHNTVLHKTWNMLYSKQQRQKWGQCAPEHVFGSSKDDGVLPEVIICVKNMNNPFHDIWDGTSLSVILDVHV